MMVMIIMMMNISTSYSSHTILGRLGEDRIMGNIPRDCALKMCDGSMHVNYFRILTKNQFTIILLPLTTIHFCLLSFQSLATALSLMIIINNELHAEFLTWLL